MNNYSTRFDLNVLTAFTFVGVAIGILLVFMELNLMQRMNTYTAAFKDGTAQSTLTEKPSDEIVTFDPGVHVFPAKDFPQRLAEFIDQNRQTVVITVCPLATPKHPEAGFLVLTRPDPEWLKILPGSARPPDNR